jgi:hypothetical protein
VGLVTPALLAVCMPSDVADGSMMGSGEPEIVCLFSDRTWPCAIGGSAFSAIQYWACANGCVVVKVVKDKGEGFRGYFAVKLSPEELSTSRGESRPRWKENAWRRYDAMAVGPCRSTCASGPCQTSDVTHILSTRQSRQLWEPHRRI